jgi:hypothetical protein
MADSITTTGASRSDQHFAEQCRRIDAGVIGRSRPMVTPRSKREQVQYELGRVGPRKLAWFVIDAARGTNSRTFLPGKRPSGAEKVAK